MYTIVGYNGTLTAESAALEITKRSDRSCVWKPFRKELLFDALFSQTWKTLPPALHLKFQK
jgi:hypothetical protein